MSWNVQWYYSNGHTFDAKIVLESTDSEQTLTIIAPEKDSGFHGVVPFPNIMSIQSGYENVQKKAVHNLGEEDSDKFFSIVPRGGSLADTLDFKTNVAANRDSIVSVLGKVLQERQEALEKSIKSEEVLVQKEAEIERNRIESENEIKARRASIDRARAEAEALKVESERLKQEQVLQQQNDKILMEQYQQERRELALERERIEKEMRSEEARRQRVLRDLEWRTAGKCTCSQFRGCCD